MAKKELNPEDVKRRALETAEVVEDALRNISSQVGDIFKDALDSTSTFSKTITSDITKGINNLARTTTTLISNQEKLKSGSLTRAQIEKQIQERSIKIQAIEQQINIAKKAGLISTKEANKQLSQAVAYENEFVADLEQQAKLADQFNKKLGITGKTIKGLNKIPVLGGLINSEEVLARIQKKTTEEGATKFGVFKEGIKGVGSSIKESLVDPSVLMGGGFALLTKTVKFFVDAMFEADKRVTALSRNLQISKEEAQGIDAYFKSTKDSLETQYKLTKEIYQAQAELSELSATSTLYGKDILDAQIQLTKEYGLQVQDAANLNKIFIVNDENANNALDTAAKTTSEFFKQNKVLFSERKLLEQASKISGQLLVSFRGSTTELIKAVAQANKLGITLDQAKNISESMLDFESSISAELEAELLTGKDLNLERARSLALQGDFAGAAKEALKNVKSLEEFQNMNVIQQQALAKATGLTVDQLSDALIQQKLVTKESQSQYARLKEANQDELARRFALGQYDEKEIEAANKRLDAQQKFNLSIDKVKEVFTDLVDGGALDAISNAAMALADTIASGGSLFTLFGKSDLTENIEKRSLQQAQQTKLELEQKIKDKEKLTKGEQERLLKAQERLKEESDRKREDQIAEEKSSARSGYIREPLSKEIKTKDYILKTLPEDTVVGAGGTKLGRTEEMVSLLKELIVEVKKGGNVYLDGTKVGTAMSVSTYKVQ
jgi:hypothetical protein